MSLRRLVGLRIVLLGLVTSLLIVVVRPLLIVVLVLKIEFLPVLRTIVVDEAYLFLTFQTINLVD